MTVTTTRSDARAQDDDVRFDDLGVSAPVSKALKMRGIDEPFPIQALVLPDAIAGRDIQARSRTGSGKTLAFAVPIVERLQHSGRSPQALILCPTRELASQVTEEFRAIADVKQLSIAAVYGGVAIGPQARSARHADVVIATPGRLLDLVQRKQIRLDRVRIAVLDEADRMLDMGFLPDVKRILALLRDERQTMLFSATLEGEIAKLADGSTHDAVRHELGDGRPTGVLGHPPVRRRGAPRPLPHARPRARGRPGADPRVHADEARCRPPGEEPEARRLPGRGPARRLDPGPARAGARALRRRPQRCLGRDRRRRAWAGPGTHQPRDQLRSSRR